MSGIDLEEVRAIADDHEALGFVHAPRMMRFCVEEIDSLRSQLSALREALSDAAWAALGASVHTPLQDPDPKNEVGSGYGKAYNHGAYQAALAVHRHVTAALASTEPGGEEKGKR